MLVHILIWFFFLTDAFILVPKFPKKEFLLRVSYMEIYNETVTDLLVDSWKRKPLEIRETLNVRGPGGAVDRRVPPADEHTT